MTDRPQPGSSVERYVRLLPDGDLIELYVQQMESLYSLISQLSETEAEFRYEAGKWSVKEMIGHLADTERVCSYRLLCAARGDATPMPSFDQDEYVIQGAFHKRPILEILEEWRCVRECTISLLQSLAPESLQNAGTFKNRPTSALEVACMIPGHVNHHMNILRERYQL